MYTVWDIWKYRNALLFVKGGATERATNKELDLQIREEFTISTANLKAEDKKLFCKYTCPMLIDRPISDKQHW